MRVIALARWPVGLTFSGGHGRPENIVGSKLPLYGIVTGGHDAVTGSQEAPDRTWEDRAR
jgi:hypothetical protein